MAKDAPQLPLNHVHLAAGCFAGCFGCTGWVLMSWGQDRQPTYVSEIREAIGYTRLARPSVTILRPKCCTLVVPHHLDVSMLLAGHSSACRRPIGKRHACDVIWLRQALGQCKPSPYTAYSAFRDYISHSCTSVIATRVFGSEL